MPDREEAVLAANAEFYRAFEAGDIEAMEALWSPSSPMACVHPGWPPLSGREDVIDSWTGILGSDDYATIQFHAAKAHILGDTAFVVCLEVLPGTVLVATNVFKLEQADWKMVHHHASPLPVQLGLMGGGSSSERLH